jgi:hypothetical protein
VEKKILLFLPRDFNTDTQQTILSHHFSPSNIVLLDVLTFHEIYSRPNFDEEKCVAEMLAKLHVWGLQLDIPADRQFVEIGTPAYKINEFVNKFKIDLLLTTKENPSRYPKMTSSCVTGCRC